MGIDRLNIDEVVDRLRACGFLQNLSEDHLRRFAELADSVEFQVNDVISREGEPADNLLVILSGSAAIEICAPGIGCRRIMTLSDGDLLCWSAVLEHARLTATVRATTPIDALSFNGRQLLTLCEHDPAFGYAFMRRMAHAMAQRLTSARIQLLDVFGNQIPHAPDPLTE